MMYMDIRSSHFASIAGMRDAPDIQYHIIRQNEQTDIEYRRGGSLQKKIKKYNDPPKGWELQRNLCLLLLL